MKLKKIVIDFITTFFVVLVAAVVVSFLYSLLVHGSGAVDWENSIRLGIIFGIVLTWMNPRQKS
jgi:hypothetical protein